VRSARFALATLLALLGLLAARAPRADPSLVGQFLVATDEMPDARFSRTVIYMVRHDAAGALGLVVNRPLGDMPLADVLARFGVTDRDARGEIRVHYGGPVDPGRGFVLHTSDYVGPGSRLIADGIAVTTDVEILTAMAHGGGPRRSLFALGYAGWAPGQLEREIRRGGWVSVAADAALLFDRDHERKWERAMARRRIDV